MAEPARDILLMATADWDNPFWTNKQHVAVELARAGRRVLYLESAGLRRPSARPADLARIGRRLARAVRAPREVRPGLWVVSPPSLPLQGRAWIRALNRRLLRAALASASRAVGFTPRTLWTYSPLTTALLDIEGFERVLYHAVDDIAAQPGMPSAAIRRAEADLARRCDVVFATSPALQARHAAAGARRCRFSPNVVDPDHFGQALHLRFDLPADLASIPSPRIGLVGAVSGYKLDFGLLAALARLRPGYSFVLIGKSGEGEPWSDARALEDAPNIHRLGPRPYGELPAYMAGFGAALLACPASPYTEAMFPMKFFEYLAAGLPVISTPLPALSGYARLAHIVPADPSSLAHALDRALAGEGAALSDRLAAAAAHTYAGRTADMLAELDALQSR